MAINERDPALRRALEEAGGPTGMAAYISKHFDPITVQAVSQWRRCPSDRALQVEAATQGKVSRHDLRPDLYPLERAA